MDEHQTSVEATKAAAAVAKPQGFPVNVYETDHAVVVVAPLPGVMSEDVTLQVSEGSLTIDADLRSIAPTKRYLVQEWTYGPYRREVAIPPGWGSKVEASLGNGQLAVRLLKGEPPEAGIVTSI